MNSRQRRQLRRQYPYLVITRYRDYGSYLDAWEWLKERYGVGRLQPQNQVDAGWHEEFTSENDLDNWNFGVKWHFKRSLDATEFALRWS